mmetsp:Transcript_61869/g.199508  ORF Transcript_61869/g.199508 Transcript_61869/m.199508 type:complete len:287 (-) Transcript_61869:889-1749(-)
MQGPDGHGCEQLLAIEGPLGSLAHDLIVIGPVPVPGKLGLLREAHDLGHALGPRDSAAGPAAALVERQQPVQHLATPRQSLGVLLGYVLRGVRGPRGDDRGEELGLAGHVLEDGPEGLVGRLHEEVHHLLIQQRGLVHIHLLRGDGPEALLVNEVGVRGVGVVGRKELFARCLVPFLQVHEVCLEGLDPLGQGLGVGVELHEGALLHLLHGLVDHALLLCGTESARSRNLLLKVGLWRPRRLLLAVLLLLVDLVLQAGAIPLLRDKGAPHLTVHVVELRLEEEEPA